VPFSDVSVENVRTIWLCLPIQNAPIVLTSYQQYGCLSQNSISNRGSAIGAALERGGENAVLDVVRMHVSSP
jgi:hypothetical protein